MIFAHCVVLMRVNSFNKTTTGPFAHEIVMTSQETGSFEIGLIFHRNFSEWDNSFNFIISENGCTKRYMHLHINLRPGSEQCGCGFAALDSLEQGQGAGSEKS